MKLPKTVVLVFALSAPTAFADDQPEHTIVPEGMSDSSAQVQTREQHRQQYQTRTQVMTGEAAAASAFERADAFSLQSRETVRTMARQSDGGDAMGVASEQAQQARNRNQYRYQERTKEANRYRDGSNASERSSQRQSGNRLSRPERVSRPDRPQRPAMHDRPARPTFR